MSSICLYIDEDSMDCMLVRALRARNVDVITVQEVKRNAYIDAEQLEWATTHNRVIYSGNIGDFYNLHTTYITEGRLHAGIILVQQQRYSVGEQLRGILNLMATKSAEEMRNQLVFLGAYIKAE